MEQALTSLPTQARKLWSGFDRAQRTRLTVAGALLAALVFGLAFWSAQPEYVTLYSQLTQAEIGDIVLELKERKVPYRLVDRGRTILVPITDVYDLRLALASEGLPREESGADLFGVGDLGMTEFAQRVNYKKSLQAELGKMIGRLEPVEWAKVQIVIPEPAVFIRDEKPATASVVLKLRPGYVLSQSQIAGITYLVSSSVKGLQPQHVTITDDYGRPLSAGQHDEEMRLLGSRFDIERRAEEHLTEKAQSMLDKMLGTGNSVVRVDISMNWDEVSEREVTYDKDKRVSRREQLSSKSKSSLLTSGAAGAVSNTPGSPGAKQRPMRDTETEEEIEYEVPTTERTVVKKPGAVDAVFVAVGVDDGFSGRTEEIRDAVGAAVGVEKTLREQMVEVKCMALAGVAGVIPSTPARHLPGPVWQLVRWGFVAVVALVFLYMIHRTFREPPPPREDPAALDTAAGAPGALPEGDADAEPIEPQPELPERVVESILRDPEGASSVIHAWMREGRA